MIPIVFSINEKYGTQCYLAIYSLEQVLRDEDDYSITILYEKLSQDMMEKINGLESKHVTIQFLCVGKYLHEEMYEKVHYTKEIYFRLLIPSLLPYDKVIYLDSDILIMRGLRELYEVEMGGGLIAGCEDIFEYKNPFSKNGKWKTYINTGVLVINCKEFIKEKLFEKSMELLHEYQKLQHPDQDVLNILCQDRIRVLPYYWNQIVSNKKHVVYEKGILHFAGVCKPWNTGNIEIYAVYYDMVKRAGEKEWFFKRLTFRKTVESRKDKMLYIAENLYQKGNVQASNVNLRKMIKISLLVKFGLFHPGVFRNSAIILKELVLYLPLECSELMQLLRCVDYVKQVTIFVEEFKRFAKAEELKTLLWKSSKVGRFQFIETKEEIPESELPRFCSGYKSFQDLVVQRYYCNRDRTIFYNGRWFFCSRQYLDFWKRVSRYEIRAEIHRVQEQRYSEVCRDCIRGTIANTGFFEN